MASFRVVAEYAHGSDVSQYTRLLTAARPLDCLHEHTHHEEPCCHVPLILCLVALSTRDGDSRLESNPGTCDARACNSIECLSQRLVPPVYTPSVNLLYVIGVAAML